MSLGMGGFGMFACRKAASNEWIERSIAKKLPGILQETNELLVVHNRKWVVRGVHKATHLSLQFFDLREGAGEIE